MLDNRLGLDTHFSPALSASRCLLPYSVSQIATPPAETSRRVCAYNVHKVGDG